MFSKDQALIRLCVEIFLVVQHEMNLHCPAASIKSSPPVNHLESQQQAPFCLFNTNWLGAEALFFFFCQLWFWNSVMLAGDCIFICFAVIFASTVSSARLCWLKAAVIFGPYVCEITNLCAAPNCSHWLLLPSLSIQLYSDSTNRKKKQMNDLLLHKFVFSILSLQADTDFHLMSLLTKTKSTKKLKKIFAIN